MKQISRINIPESIKSEVYVDDYSDLGSSVKTFLRPIKNNIVLSDIVYDSNPKYQKEFDNCMDITFSEPSNFKEFGLVEENTKMYYSLLLFKWDQNGKLIHDQSLEYENYYQTINRSVIEDYSWIIRAKAHRQRYILNWPTFKLHDMGPPTEDINVYLKEIKVIPMTVISTDYIEQYVLYSPVMYTTDDIDRRWRCPSQKMIEYASNLKSNIDYIRNLVK